MTTHRVLALMLAVLLVLPDGALAAKKKKCRRLCKATIAACVTDQGCASLPKRRDRKRCKRTCKKNTLAQCRQDSDKTRCVPPTPTTTTRTTLPTGPLVRPIHRADRARRQRRLPNINPEPGVSVFSVLRRRHRGSRSAGSEQRDHPPGQQDGYVANARDGTVSVVDLPSRTTPASTQSAPSRRRSPSLRTALGSTSRTPRRTRFR
jgi:hypothetical protein